MKEDIVIRLIDALVLMFNLNAMTTVSKMK